VAAVTVLAAVVLATISALVTHAVAGNPFHASAQATPLVVAVLVAVVVGTLYATGRREAAGLVGAVAIPTWIAFFCAWQLAGTPYPYGGMVDDIGRLTAFAGRFTVRTASSDQFVPGLPSDYPPLFPWLVGKTSVVLGVPAWRVIGPFGVIFTAAAPVVGYVLWRRIVSVPAALAAGVIPIAYWGWPSKAYEVMALCLLAPWVLGSFGRWPDKPLLHWLPAGVIGGLMVTDYPGFLAYCVLGVAAIIGMGLLPRDGRLDYVRHTALVIATAAVVSSWYLVPWMISRRQHGSSNQWIHFMPADIRANMWDLPWRKGAFVCTLLIGGFAFLVYYCRRERWARYLLAIALSTLLYRWAFVIVFNATGNSGILEYTARLSDPMLTIGFVLGLIQLRRDARAMSLPPLAMAGITRAAPVALVAVLATVLGAFWQHERVGSSGFNMARIAQAMPLPDGRPGRYAAETHLDRTPFPAIAVHRDVESVLGRGALPVALSYSEQIAAFYPFYLYASVGAYSANAMSLWPKRHAELVRLAAIHDPNAFAAAAAHTAFGPIDVFILHDNGVKLIWRRSVGYLPGQFSPTYFTVFHEADDTWVYVRRDAVVRHHSYPS